MIHCIPRSICSWDYSVSGLSSGAALVEYDWLTEQGRIDVAQEHYDIRKHGALSGHWSLEHDGRSVAEAHKPSALFRTFEISSIDDWALTLQAESAFHRAFELIHERQVVGRICPAHAFTRRATIQCDDGVPEHVQLFAFWLVGLSWRRSARRRNSS